MEHSPRGQQHTEFARNCHRRWSSRRRNRVAWTFVILSALAIPSCGQTDSDSAIESVSAALLDLSAGTFRNQVCGPIGIALLVPDCPRELVCFTTACETHNICYGICGAGQDQCDLEFLQNMLQICQLRVGVIGRRARECNELAALYYAAVRLLGREAFAQTQEGLCTPADVPPDTPGVCCRADSDCDDAGTRADCSDPDDLFVPFDDCGDFDCTPPENDACPLAESICEDVTDDSSLGRCEGDPSEACMLAAPACSDGGACVAESRNDFRCVVATDNRAATTDGPSAGGDCASSGPNSFQADVWYRYIAPCTGRLTVRMCDRQRYDSMLAVHTFGNPDGVCPCPTDNLQLLRCDDDFCGPVSTSAVVVDRVLKGACYTLRVGGWSGTGTAGTASQGTSELDIVLECEPP